MDKPNTDCRKLTEKTAKVLNNNRILQQLFVSTQTNNLALCIEYAVTKCVTPISFCESISHRHFRVLVPDIMNGGLSITSLCIMSKWFPHVVVSRLSGCVTRSNLKYVLQSDYREVFQCVWGYANWPGCKSFSLPVTIWRADIYMAYSGWV